MAITHYGAEVRGDALRIGPNSAPITQIAVFSPVLSPAQIAANTTAEQTFSVTGLKLNNADGSLADKIITVIKPTAQAGIGIVGWRVSADDTLAITFSNNTAGALTPTASQTYQVVALRTLP